MRHETDEQPGPARGLVWVDPDPTGVITIWLPGLNSKACRARRVVAGQRAATQLAKGIENAGKVGGGEYACPADDGSDVEIYLTYADHRDEYATVDLTGCRWIEAPARGARWVNNETSKTLRALSPPAWRSYN